MSEVWTVGRLLEWSAPFFKQKGIEQARLDAEVLLAHVLKIDRIHLYTGYDRPLEDSELAAYKALVQRRAKREPVAYIVGKRGFMDLDLKVDRRALIPRPETELLVELAIKALPQAAVFADIGTGTGAIVLALKQARPDTIAHASDVSADALALARENAAQAKLEVTFHEGSLLAPYAGMQLDAVLSNPPYVESGAALAPEVKDFEPALALFAGDDGLSIIRRLLADARPVLKDGGWMFIEHGKGQAEAVCQIATEQGYRDTRSERDLDGIERIFCARR